MQVIIFQTIIKIANKGSRVNILQSKVGFELCFLVWIFFSFKDKSVISVIMSVGINWHIAGRWICTLLMSLFQRMHISANRMWWGNTERHTEKVLFFTTKWSWQAFVFCHYKGSNIKKVPKKCLAAQEHLGDNNGSWAWIGSNVSTAHIVTGDKALKRRDTESLSTSQLSSHPNKQVENITFVFLSFCLLHTISFIPLLG